MIALDGTPTVAKWQLMLGKELQHRPVLSDEEKKMYFREILGIRVVQTTEAANHYSGKSGISVTPQQDLALIEAVRRREKVQPCLITSQSAEMKYLKCGLEELIEDVERDVRHYGEFKGSNDFGEIRVGIVVGSPHYGDNQIQKWCALAGESVIRAEGTKGVGQDFGPYGNQILHGMRENEVLQAIMRFGRDTGGATVYVHTGALPEWVERDEYVTELWKWPDGMCEVLGAIKEHGEPEWRTKNISENVSICEQMARKHLNKLVSFGYLNRWWEGRGYTYSDERLDTIGEFGHVEFGPGKLAS